MGQIVHLVLPRLAAVQADQGPAAAHIPGVTVVGDDDGTVPQEADTGPVALTKHRGQLPRRCPRVSLVVGVGNKDVLIWVIGPDRAGAGPRQQIGRIVGQEWALVAHRCDQPAGRQRIHVDLATPLAKHCILRPRAAAVLRTVETTDSRGYLRRRAIADAVRPNQDRQQQRAVVEAGHAETEREHVRHAGVNAPALLPGHALIG